jgi:hypothetical protein
MFDDPMCLVYIGGLIGGAGSYVYFEKAASKAIDGLLAEVAKDLEDYAKNRSPWKRSYHIDDDLRIRLKGVRDGLNGITCPPFAAVKRVRVKSYINRFLREDKNMKIKDACTIAKEFRKAAEGKSNEI